MTVKDLYVYARSYVRIKLYDDLSMILLYTGSFENVPYKYIHCNICDYYVKDNKLVIKIYD